MTRKILVIDDESDIKILFRQKFRREIRSGTMAFAFAGNGEEALGILQDDSDISVVFTDLNMPGMDGLTFLRHAADLHRPLALVVVSAYGDMINIRAAMNLGAFDFLNKPIDFNDFIVTMNKSFEHVQERQALELERRKTNFFISMSHELRTPLNAIIGYSELLAEELGDQNHQSVEDADRIGKAGQHLLALINNLLDLSKIEHGMMPVYSETTDLPQLLQDVLETMVPLAEKNENKLHLSHDLDTSSVIVDPLKLRQILLNLLANAIKFTTQGDIFLHAKPSSRLNLPAFEISVRDTGIGMTPSEISRLFQPYHQADDDVAKHYGGTGLGLVICKEYCQLMGGDIVVESQKDQGSTLTFYLPNQPTEPPTES